MVGPLDPCGSSVRGTGTCRPGRRGVRCVPARAATLPSSQLRDGETRPSLCPSGGPAHAPLAGHGVGGFRPDLGQKPPLRVRPLQPPPAVPRAAPGSCQRSPGRAAPCSPRARWARSAARFLRSYWLFWWLLAHRKPRETDRKPPRRSPTESKPGSALTTKSPRKHSAGPPPFTPRTWVRIPPGTFQLLAPRRAVGRCHRSCFVIHALAEPDPFQPVGPPAPRRTGPGRVRDRGPFLCPERLGYLHFTVLPPLTLTQLGLAGGAAGNCASPHCPVAAYGTSITIVPTSGRFAGLIG